MTRTWATRLSLVIVSLSFAASVAQAQLGATVPTWPAPSSSSGSSSRGIRALADVTNPLPFIGVTPCRIVDTRGPAGTFGGPSLPAGTPRNFPLPTGPCAGIPASVSAYSLNITVTNTQGPGFILLYPTGGSQPLVSTLNYVAGQTIANAAIVPAGTSGGVTVVAGVSGTDLIIDINGYYGPSPATVADPFIVSNTTGTNSAAIIGINASSTPFSYGVWGHMTSLSPGVPEAAVYGQNDGQNGYGYGVWGNAASGIGVFGLTGSGTGVTGQSFSNTVGAAGVFGIEASGDPGGGFVSAGVVGASVNHWAVLGKSGNTGYGVAGFSLDTTGTIMSSGYLGYNNSTGVFYNNGLTGTGTKNFVEPHPTDATKLIKYVSIEGPEAGVYFRGRGQAHKGLATIDVPENFRMVAAEEGLSIQVTPIGETANVAVMQVDLNRIVVKTTRDVEFFYTVNGVRKAYPTWNPIQENRKEFVPEGPDARLPAYLSANETQRLIDNGTYNADGTVNMGTAERAGWVKAWADREVQTQAAAREAQKAANARQR